MGRLLALFVFFGAFATAYAKDLSYSETESLPLPRLAIRMLGEAGKLMMDVERPLALPGQFRFFSHAFAPGSQYGICSSEWTTLRLDKNGAVRSITGEHRYGVEGSIYTKSEDWTYEQFTSLCSSAKSTRSYFPAPDAQAALTIVAYLDALAGRGPSGSGHYDFECTGACTGGSRDFLKRISGDLIAEATTIDCDEIALYHACYKLRLEGKPAADYPRELRIYGQYKGPQVVEIQKIKLWIGTTLH